MIVRGLAGAVAVSAGDDHACTMLESGGVQCWGDNYYGGLGDGSTLNRLAPVTVIDIP